MVPGRRLAILIANGGRIPERFVADQDRTRVLPTSEPLTSDEVKAMVSPIPHGYKSGLLFKRGDKWISAVTYEDALGHQVVITRGGRVRNATSESRITAVYVGELSGRRWEGARALPDHKVASSYSFDFDTCTAIVAGASAGAGTACGTTIGFPPLFGACALAVAIGTTAGYVLCDRLDDPPPPPPDPTREQNAILSPKAQTVSGCGNCTGVNDRASFTITGSTAVPADREVTVPFSTCSNCGDTRIRVQQGQGNTQHWYYPLSCNGPSTTVYGTVYYPSGSKSDSATVTINNPNGCSRLLPPIL